jgi:ribosomal protein S12 methylthiotransferase
MSEKVNIISLGCARNLVDSEVMAGLLGKGNYQVVSHAADAEIILVNTCGFIDAAKEESIDTIMEAARLKEQGRLKTLVVAGCLAQRYPEELMREMPEVDLFIGTGEVPRIVEILKEREHSKQRLYVGIPRYLYDHATPRRRSTPSFSAYVKVSEGCDHKCAFCIIPQLRGPHRSRAIGSVMREVEELVADGVKEVNLIAQDLTAYGRDRRDGTTLHGLLCELIDVRGIEWVRLLYAYPNYLEDNLLRLIRESETICNYIDIPFQHINANLLRRMRRGKSGSAVRESLHRLRQAVPNLTVRTSLIVGFPGEAEKDFHELLEFVEEARFDRLGVFKYSAEDGTAAAAMEDLVSEEEKERRWQGLMELQAEISREKNQALIGSVQRVMVDGFDAESARFVGRTQAHAPEVDGVVYVEAGSPLREPARKLRPGQFVAVKITEGLDYDLIGEILHA